MENIYFGDSITEGSNSPCSFVNYIPGIPIENKNLAVSGTTIGEYSIYPVDGNSLLSLYHRKDLCYFNRIFLEYGINDVSAIMCGFATMQEVIISFVKAIDGIRQLNSFADINFLTISDKDDIIEEYARRQCEYLSNDYFKGYDFNFPVSKYAELYKTFISAVNKRSDNVISMIDDITFFDRYMSSDKVHPNEKGHEVIAKKIIQSMF